MKPSTPCAPFSEWRALPPGESFVSLWSMDSEWFAECVAGRWPVWFTWERE